MRMVIRDDVIWTSHLEGDPSAFQRLLQLAPGEGVRLRVDGIVGSWEKMQTGSNGLPTQGLKPVGAMRHVWADWRVRRGEAVDVELADHTAEMDALSESLSEWMSAEDEAAYGQLQPI